MRYFFLFFFIVLTITNVYAKWIDSLDYKLYSHDTTYITRMPRKLVVRLDNRNWTDIYSIKESRESLLEMQSNLLSEVSGKIGYGIFSVGYSIGVGQKSTDSKKFNLGIYGHKISLDFDYVKTGNSTNIIVNIGEKNEKKVSFSGLKMTMYRYKCLYFFNNQHYSNDACYSGNLRMKQLKSAGSLIGGLSYAYHKIEIDTTKMTVDNISISPNTNHLEYTDYCLNIGYAYTCIFGKYWLLNYTDIPEFGLKWNRCSGKKYQMAINNTLKISLVYNHDFYFMGILGQYDSYWNFYRKSSLENSIGTFNVFIGVKL